jgi:hypothetical protein
MLIDFLTTNERSYILPKNKDLIRISIGLKQYSFLRELHIIIYFIKISNYINYTIKVTNNR